MCSVACQVFRSSGVRFAFTPRLLLSLAAMADVEEELAIVPYAGRPHPIMIRYMIDEAKGNNVNARTLKVWGCPHPRPLNLRPETPSAPLPPHPLARNVSHSHHIPFASKPCCLFSDPAPERLRLARQSYHVDRAVYVSPAHATSTSECHVAQHPSAAACRTHSEAGRCGVCMSLGQSIENRPTSQNS